MQWTQSERFWADWSRTAFRFQRAFPQLHLLHFTRPHKMPKVQALPVHWDIGCPSRQRMLQFGPSPAMQEATWATRYQLLKLTSFDLYITVYHIYIYILYISYIATPHRVLGPVCLIHHGVTEELEIICPCHSRKDKTGISWHFLLSRILSRFLRRVKKCQKSSCSTMQLLLSPSFLDTTCQAPSRITPVGRSRNVNGRIDAGQAHAPRPRHIRPICSDLRTWKVIPL